MDFKELALSTLEGLQLAAELFGRPNLAKYIEKTRRIAEANGDVEEHMGVIKAKLADSDGATNEDFADAEDRIRADLERFGRLDG